MVLLFNFAWRFFVKKGKEMYLDLLGFIRLIFRETREIARKNTKTQKNLKNCWKKQWNILHDAKFFENFHFFGFCQKNIDYFLKFFDLKIKRRKLLQKFTSFYLREIRLSFPEKISLKKILKEKNVLGFSFSIFREEEKELFDQWKNIVYFLVNKL